MELALDEETRHLLPEKCILESLAQLKGEWDKIKKLSDEDELEVRKMKNNKKIINEPFN